MTELTALKPPTTPLAQRLIDLVVWGGLAVLLVIGFEATELRNAPKIFTNAHNMREFGSAFLQPDFTDWLLIVRMMWLTLMIALWGTVLAMVIAVPLGLLCARNVAPLFIQQPVRLVVNLLRSIPDLVIGLAFIVVVGLGPFAGVMAFAINTGAVLAKLFSEAVEAIDPQPVEGVKATGASPLQTVVWGVIPQVAPLWTSYTLYRFESNARSATVLGLIGAGGIGQLLFESLNGFDYKLAAAIVIVIVIAVTLIDLLSQAMRNRLL
jgi:phosphonate transport system permease protein